MIQLKEGLQQAHPHQRIQALLAARRPAARQPHGQHAALDGTGGSQRRQRAVHAASFAAQRAGEQEGAALQQLHMLGP